MDRCIAFTLLFMVRLTDWGLGHEFCLQNGLKFCVVNFMAQKEFDFVCESSLVFGICWVSNAGCCEEAFVAS